MNILKLECHKQLADQENAIIRGLGHQVTSIGFETLPTLEESSGVPYEPPGFTENAGLVRLTKKEMAKYDLIISCFYPQNLAHIVNNYDGKILLRTLNSVHSRVEELYAESFKVRPFNIVRMSEAELNSGLNTLPCMDVIMETVDENKFKGWTGGQSTVLTVAKALYNRFDVDFDIYERVTEGFNRLLVGQENPIRPDTLVNASESDLLNTMKVSAVNYIHSRSWGCITYAFAESMMMGMPTVCLGRTWLGKHWMGAEYIKNGVNGYCSNNIDELRWIMGRLIKEDIGQLELGAEARKTALKLFSIQENTKKWKQILTSL